MRRIDHSTIREPHAGAIIASRWSLQSSGHQFLAADAALAAMPAIPDLLRFSVFRGIEDFTLFLLSQWANSAARDTYIVASSGPRAATDEVVPNIHRDWREPASPYRSFVSEETGRMGCLVVVRQPLDHSVAHFQRKWSDAVIAALESEIHPAPGLYGCSFFLSDDGAHVLNLAEWVSEESHRTAQQGGGGNLGESADWKGIPGIAAKAEVRRYQLFGAVEPCGRT